MTAPHAPADAALGDPRPVTYFGPDFPFAYDDWLRASGAAWARCRPSGTAPRSRSSVPACRRHGRRLRADAARPEAGHLRGRADRRAPALAAVRGRGGGDRRARRHALSRSPRPPSTTISTGSASRPRPVPQPARAGDAQHGDRPRRRADLRRDAPRTCRRCSARSPTPGARRWRRVPASPRSRTPSVPATCRG